MAGKNIKAKIRFKGYTDDWEQRKLGELSESFEYGLNAAAMEYDGENKYIRITDIDDNSRLFLDTNLTSPNIDLSNADNFKLKYGDILFARTGASVGKSYIYKDCDGLVYYAGFLIRARIKKKIDPEFVFYNTLTNEYNKYIRITSQRSGQPGVNAQEYAEYEVKVPNYEEQIRIGEFLRHLDNLITIHQHKYDKLINVKKSMLQKMFPKDGSSVPEIRFKGFTDDWKQRKFSEIVTSYSDPVATPRDGYTRLGIRSHAKGTFHSYVRPGMELETAKMHKVGANNFIVNITFGWEHAVAITDENDEGKLVSHRFPQFSFNETMVPQYFKFMILDEKFRYHLWLSSPGGAGRNRVLKINEMLEYPFWVTSEEEQKKIADFLINLDHLINLHQCKLEKLKKIKKSMLEKMFL